MTYSMAEAGLTAKTPIEVWLRQRRMQITCQIVHEDESVDDSLGVDSLSMRGAQREVTGRLIKDGYEPTGRWDGDSDPENGTTTECSRWFRPARSANHSSKGQPIQPLDRGRQVVIASMEGPAFIAERQPDSTGQIYAMRLFTGDVENRTAGDTFDAYHKVYPHPPCGHWTILTTLINGGVTTGQIPEGVVKLRVNAIG
jgi:hypothetical protein